MRDEDKPVVKLEKVTKDYGVSNSVFALDAVDLEIHRGESVAITGPSGSGKSTLLNLLCGLDRQTTGKIFFEGTDISELDDDRATRLRREKIGMIFQSFNLLPTLNATENVSLPLRLRGQAKQMAEEQAQHLLERVGLDKRAGHRPDEMSGGERQHVAIARALVFNPPLLLADEPTGNLDSRTGGDVLKLLGELRREFNTTIVLVTHDAQAAAYCERQITFKDGRIVADNASSTLVRIIEKVRR